MMRLANTKPSSLESQLTADLFSAGLIPPQLRLKNGRERVLDTWRSLHPQVRAVNPKYKEAEGSLVGQFQSDIYGNRDFPTALRNQHQFFCAEESRELDLILIDYGDLGRLSKDIQTIEMLYEIISPDAFLRTSIDDYTTLSFIYSVTTKSWSGN